MTSLEDVASSFSNAGSPKNTSKNVSWVNVVQNQPSLSKHDLQVTVIYGAEMVVVPDDVLEDTPL